MPQALQRSLGDGTDVLRAAVETRLLLRPFRRLDDVEAELGRYLHPVAQRPQSLADQNFIGEGPVDFRRVEKGHAEVDGAVQRPDRIGLFLAAIAMAHAHASEADRKDAEVCAELAWFHIHSASILFQAGARQLTVGTLHGA